MVVEYLDAAVDVGVCVQATETLYRILREVDDTMGKFKVFVDAS